MSVNKGFEERERAEEARWANREDAGSLARIRANGGADGAKAALKKEREENTGRGGR